MFFYRQIGSTESPKDTDAKLERISWEKCRKMSHPMALYAYIAKLMNRHKKGSRSASSIFNEPLYFDMANQVYTYDKDGGTLRWKASLLERGQWFCEVEDFLRHPNFAQVASQTKIKKRRASTDSDAEV